MAVDLSSYLNSYLSPYSMSYGSATGTNSVFDLAGAQASAKAQADQLLAAYEAKTGKSTSSTGTSKTLQADTASYLDQYAASMKALDSSAQKLRGGNLDKLLYDKDGNVTETTTGKVADAVKNMVGNYNSSIRLLSNNADRGSGTESMLARMVSDPMAKKSMEALGISVNKDGTLAFNETTLKNGLMSSTPETAKMTKDLLGNFNGLADSIHKTASAGLNMSARKLINTDLAEIKMAQEDENPYKAMYASIKGNPMLLNNQMAASMFMNLVV